MRRLLRRYPEPGDQLMMTIVKSTSRPSEQDIAAESAAASAAAQELRNHYQLRFSIEGRIRFLSHLETADTLLSAFRRAGVRLALSPGCLLYTSPSPRDGLLSRMPSSA